MKWKELYLLLKINKLYLRSLNRVKLTHWKRPWCWERLRTGGEVGDRGWGGWMASPTWRTRVWADSRRRWRIREPGVLQSRVCKEVDTTAKPNNASASCYSDSRVFFPFFSFQINYPPKERFPRQSVWLSGCDSRLKKSRLQVWTCSRQRMGWLDNITDSMDINLGKLGEMVRAREAWRAPVHGASKSQTRLSGWTARAGSRLATFTPFMIKNCDPLLHPCVIHWQFPVARVKTDWFMVARQN